MSKCSLVKSFDVYHTEMRGGFWIFLIKQCEGYHFPGNKVSVFNISGLVQLAHTVDERNPANQLGCIKP